MVQAMDFCFGFMINSLCDFDHVSQFYPVLSEAWENTQCGF